MATITEQATSSSVKTSTSPVQPPINLEQWIERNREKFKPPVSNRYLYDGRDFFVMVIKGPNVIRGYENNPEANATAFTDGWFRTGDQGVLDPDGYLSLVGRLKEMINRGGEKIAPREIDEVLLAQGQEASAHDARQLRPSQQRDDDGDREVDLEDRPLAR